MAREWKALCKGVRYYETSEMMVDPEDKRRRRPVRVFCLNYRYGGKVVNESIGSENLYSESEVLDIARTLEKNRRESTAPFTWTQWKVIRNREYERQKEEERLAENKTFWSFFQNIYIPFKQRQVECEKISEKYLKNLKSLCELWAKPVIGNLLFDDITSDHFVTISINMRSRVQKKKKIRLYDSSSRKYEQKNVLEHARSISTCKTLRAILYEVWGRAASKNYTNRVFPGNDMVSKEYNNRRTKTFSDDELKMIFKELRMRSIDTYHIAVISAFSGLRSSSICKLNWEELQDSVSRDSKNKDNISLGMFQVDEVLKSIIEERRKMFPDDTNNDYVFKRKHADKDGNLNTPLKSVSKTFSRVVEDLRLNEHVKDNRARACFHTLRHTCATMLLRAGISLDDIATILGHKTTTMARRYAHEDISSHKRAAPVLKQRAMKIFSE